MTQHPEENTNPNTQSYFGRGKEGKPAWLLAQLSLVKIQKDGQKIKLRLEHKSVTMRQLLSALYEDPFISSNSQMCKCHFIIFHSKKRKQYARNVHPSWNFQIHNISDKKHLYMYLYYIYMVCVYALIH